MRSTHEYSCVITDSTHVTTQMAARISSATITGDMLRSLGCATVGHGARMSTRRARPRSDIEPDAA
ncbi:hypothetical protein GCM10027568_06030 [Humibacter soli]